MAKGYHKLLAYKDEYEVARLLLTSQQKAAAEFDGDFKMTFHLAPPILSRTGPDGRPLKREFGAWMQGPLKLMARFKVLRGTPFDLFGYTAERRMERALIKQYEKDMKVLLPKVDAGHAGHCLRAGRPAAGHSRLWPRQGRKRGQGRQTARGIVGRLCRHTDAESHRSGVICRHSVTDMS